MVSTKCKSKIFAYGVKFTHVSCADYVSRFACTQINVHVSRSAHVYEA